ncbi:hypothetical protein [Tahibacter harae]|uniref:Uncharacterized protein n=1 Tax=Tahibacter harae TaxID=2963937 RepID=A0ABT1QMZ1_9GAMM|nr:hypothetical protein [Tahibacter harae]MCQ4163792.1 hypothetical protein [Tahibacter harae]
MSPIRNSAAALAAALACALGAEAQAQYLQSAELNYVDEIPHVRMRWIWSSLDDSIQAVATFDGTKVRINVSSPAESGFSVLMPWEANVPLPPTGGGQFPIEILFHGEPVGGIHPLVFDSRPAGTVFSNGFQR